MHVALLSVSNELVVPNSKIVTWPNTKNPDCQACLKPANTILRRENHCFWMLTRRCPRHAVRNTSLTQHKCSEVWPRMWSLAGFSQIYAPETTSPTLQYRDRARSFPELFPPMPTPRSTKHISDTTQMLRSMAKNVEFSRVEPNLRPRTYFSDPAVQRPCTQFSRTNAGTVSVMPRPLSVL